MANKEKLDTVHMVKLLIGVVFVLIVSFSLLVLSIVSLSQNKKKNTEQPTLYNSNEYQIVFLQNNLFYFCQLNDYNKEYVECNEPYYLVRKSEEGEAEDRTFVAKPSDEEVYQPDGPIYIRKENIVYISKVGEDSSVLQFINEQE